MAPNMTKKAEFLFFNYLFIYLSASIFFLFIYLLFIFMCLSVLSAYIYVPMESRREHPIRWIWSNIHLSATI